MNDPAQQETDLVTAASAGDAIAVDTLLERHLPGLRAYVRLRMGRVLRERESCSDLVQSVCREILQHLDRFRYPGETQFRRWLYKEAARKISNRVRYHVAERRDAGRDVRAGQETHDLRLSQLYATILTPSRQAIAREHAQRVEQAFDDLPEDYREVIILARIVGLSRAEIATEMGRSEASVRNLLHRALAELAELLTRGGC